MNRVPTIVFKHAAKKGAPQLNLIGDAAKWGFQPRQWWAPKVVPVQSPAPTSANEKSPAPYIRLSEPPPRGTLSEAEMDAIMLGGASD